MKPISRNLAGALRVIIILGVFCLSGAAYALNTDSVQGSTDLIKVTGSLEQNDQSRDDTSLRSVLQPLRHAQSNRDSNAFRSKSDVIREVKNRYNGQVVKISLNERTATYSVRVLLPNGKVKSLSVNARK